MWYVDIGGILFPLTPSYRSGAGSRYFLARRRREIERHYEDVKKGLDLGRKRAGPDTGRTEPGAGTSNSTVFGTSSLTLSGPRASPGK